ncbi:MAG: methylated-DNA--[protein]-cysteine S-methyltransferase, partial [Bradyrhizobium sp.]
MSLKAKSPHVFDLDRLPTPIGVALLVTDVDGVLCALDWEDYEPRMRQLLRQQHGAVELKPAAAPRELTRALQAYFEGDLDRLGGIRWRVAGTPFQRRVWTALTQIAPGTTMSYGAL